MRVPQTYRPQIEAGRLLIISPFADTQKRVTQPAAEARNQMVAMLAVRVLVAHAAPGGKMAAFCGWLAEREREVERLDDGAK